MLKVIIWLPVSRAFKRFQSWRSKDLAVLLFLVFDLLAGAAVVHHFENEAITNPAKKISFNDCVWLAVTTATTVGYGDISASTPGGRVASVLFFYVGGVGVAAYLLSRIVEVGLDFRLKKRRGLVRVNLEDHIIICNHPSERMLDQMVAELRTDPRSQERAIVVVCDNLEELPADHEDVQFVKGSPMEEEPLRRAGVTDAWMAIVLAPDLDHSHADALVSATVVMIKGINKNCICVVECADRSHEALLRTCGADRLVFAGNLASNLIVQEAIDKGISGLIADLSSNQSGVQFYSEQNGAENVTVEKCRGALKDFDQCAHLLALYREIGNNREWVTLPETSEPILNGDYVIYVARQRLDWQEIQDKLH